LGDDSGWLPILHLSLLIWWGTTSIRGVRGTFWDDLASDQEKKYGSKIILAA